MQLVGLAASGLPLDVSLVEANEYDVDNLPLDDYLIIVMPTWEDGAPPPNGAVWAQWLKEQALDFRVDRTWLRSLKYAVYGCGNQEYGDLWCAAALAQFNQLGEIGAVPLLPLGYGDDSADQEAHFAAWCEQLVPELATQVRYDTGVAEQAGSSAGGCATCHEPAEAPAAAPRAQAAPVSKDGSGTPREEEDELNDIEVEYDIDADDSGSEVVDLEDLGQAIARSKAAAAAAAADRVDRAMVTPAQYRRMTKQGYKIIGTHSAVKLCRWTKHHLRGRGACYKRTCYGILSSQCMEATPSLACSSRCTFCWRGSQHPLGRVWRWATDEPLDIVTQAIEQHVKMIHELKGVPGVRMDRWEASHTVRHCALSLIGEPIFYPRINELVQLLHERNISTFLVTNAQYPDAMLSLVPVTQLYVSIDAATKESLKAIDRPLFKDFWERFLACLRTLADKQQRTVYRLTLVKDKNMEDGMREYARLIAMGRPTFVEVKGVTYCGNSAASDMTMANVPYHHEVRAWCEQLAEVCPGYELAVEHEHSNTVLLARSEFKIDGVWHTWIDYDKFHELATAQAKGGPAFGALDYCAPTPEWAWYGAPEAGFDPSEVRFRRTKHGKASA